MTRISVHDLYQSDYQYELTAPEGVQFDDNFTPELTPQQMLELGVFGGAYFDTRSNELPAQWFKDARLSSDGHQHAELNYFDVLASQSLQEWQRKGWIHEQDPRGWFQWYARYYLGRRTPEEDARQIKRWKAIRRHVGQIKKGCAPLDLSCRRRQRQALLHWAYDSRKI